MPDDPPRIARSHMSPQERHLRSQLNQLLAGAGLLRGTLNPREKVCGKPNCRCARGEKHLCLYLVASEGGKPRQIFVPRSLEPQVRQWVASYQRLRELLEELSQLHWDKLSRREL